jgi:hypothetical protein
VAAESQELLAVADHGDRGHEDLVGQDEAEKPEGVAANPEPEQVEDHGLELRRGNTRTWENVPIGPNPGRSPAARFVACRRVSSIVTSGYRYR